MAEDDTDIARQAAERRLAAQRTDAPMANPLLQAIQESDPVQKQRMHEQVERAIAWLEAKWAKGTDGTATRCPYCEHNSWSVGPPLELVTRRSAMAPMFPVVCDTCGHTTFISAVIAGLAPDPTSEP
jgi:hypothetical protein